MSVPPDDRSDDSVRAELRSLGRQLGRGEVQWETPPAELWSRLEAAVHAEPASDVADRRPFGDPGDLPPGPPARRTATRTETRVRERRYGRRARGWLIAAAALVAVAAVGGWWILRDHPASRVAEVALDPLIGSGSGEAELLDEDGEYWLQVTTSGLPAPDGYFEVWMINPEVTGMVSLGPLRRDGRYEVPTGIDPAAYPIVDVSVEPIDGQPAHSGRSVLRGRLPL